MNPNTLAAAAMILVLVLFGWLVLSPAKSQTMHPDVVWLYGLVEKLDARVKKIEDRVNTLEKKGCVASGGSLATCDYIPR